MGKIRPPLSNRCKRLGRLPEGMRCLGDDKIEQFLNQTETEFIGKFQFGDVYRGTYKGKDVVVKIWKEPEGKEDDRSEEKEDRLNDEIFWRGRWENEGRLEDEYILHDYFTHYEFHPNIAKMVYFCRGPKHVAAIYYVQPKAINTLHNLIEKDDFTWGQRIKVAFGLASLLRFMHYPHPKCPSNLPYLIRNIDAAHILVDQEHEALLFDFSMVSGGILTDKRELLNQKIYGCSGYTDPSSAQQGKWSDASDVFSYGVVLLSLISKKVYKDDSKDNTNVYLWAKANHKQHNSTAIGDKHKLRNSAAPGNKHKLRNSAARGNKFLLVDDSLKSEPDYYFDDAVAITNLAMKCVKSNTDKRPTMKEVVKHMQNLLIVRKNRDAWECCRMLDGVGADEIFKSNHHLKDDRVKWQPSKWHWGLSRKQSTQEYMNKMQEYKHQGPKFKSPASFESSIGKDNVIKVLHYKDLLKATDKFSNENLIGKFLFGKLFHGKTEENKQVTVKIWETNGEARVYEKGNKAQLRDEISLLQHPKLLSHRNMAKIIGYCFEEGKLGGVYDLDPLDSLHNLAPKDEFSWIHRVKVIYELAKLLEFFHTLTPPYSPYRVGNIDAAHIILDKDYSPKLLDFGMTIGGIILSSREGRIKQVRTGFYYYWDPRDCRFYEAGDISGFGCIVLSLIHKKVPTRDENVKERFIPYCDVVTDFNEHSRKKSEYLERKEKEQLSNDDEHLESEMLKEFSFVHKSLEKDKDFNENDGVELTNLGLDCTDGYAYDRPSMAEVVSRLEKLHLIEKMGYQKLYEAQC